MANLSVLLSVSHSLSLSGAELVNTPIWPDYGHIRAQQRGHWTNSCHGKLLETNKLNFIAPHWRHCSTEGAGRWRAPVCTPRFGKPIFYDYLMWRQLGAWQPARQSSIQFWLPFVGNYGFSRLFGCSLLPLLLLCGCCFSGWCCGGGEKSGHREAS